MTSDDSANHDPEPEVGAAQPQTLLVLGGGGGDGFCTDDACFIPGAPDQEPAPG